MGFIIGMCFIWLPDTHSEKMALDKQNCVWYLRNSDSVMEVGSFFLCCIRQKKKFTVWLGKKTLVHNGKTYGKGHMGKIVI